MLNVFIRRVIKPELLDHLPPDEARPNLADLIRINQHFGGHSVILKTLARVAQRDEAFSLLDIGSASGDTARTIKATYPRSRVVSFDYNATNIAAAPRPKIIGNAFALPFAPASFDYVLCSLFLHHFQNEQVVELLRNFFAAAHKALLVCDLERNVIPFLFLPATKYVMNWKKVTVHDGMISVRASFTDEELKSLAEQAGIASCETSVHRPAFRISMIARK
ncbi:MAG: methyltransferase domain-containing protein [Acidobacteriaceae bacterium]|nr:methyltransferase domain-containing protein [Acidobacteriaceae bacterium]